MVQLSHDYSDFDPTKQSKVTPDTGFYTLKVLGAKVDTKAPEAGGYAFVTVGYQVETGANVGQQFELDYLTGHENTDTTAKWAFEALGRIFYGATGEKPGRNGFDTTAIAGRTFACEIEVKEKKSVNADGSPKLKKDGTQWINKNVKMRGIKPIDASAQPTEQPAAAPTQGQATWG